MTAFCHLQKVLNKEVLYFAYPFRVSAPSRGHSSMYGTWTMVLLKVLLRMLGMTWTLWSMWDPNRPVACKLRNINWWMTSHLDYCLDCVLLSFLWRNTTTTTSTSLLGSACQNHSRNDLAYNCSSFYACTIFTETSTLWLSRNHLPNAHEIWGAARSSWFSWCWVEGIIRDHYSIPH